MNVAAPLFGAIPAKICGNTKCIFKVLILFFDMIASIGVPPCPSKIIPKTLLLPFSATSNPPLYNALLFELNDLAPPKWRCTILLPLWPIRAMWLHRKGSHFYFSKGSIIELLYCWISMLFYLISALYTRLHQIGSLVLVVLHAP